MMAGVTLAEQSGVARRVDSFHLPCNRLHSVKAHHPPLRYGACASSNLPRSERTMKPCCIMHQFEKMWISSGSLSSTAPTQQPRLCHRFSNLQHELGTILGSGGATRLWDVSGTSLLFVSTFDPCLPLGKTLLILGVS